MTGPDTLRQATDGIVCYSLSGTRQPRRTPSFPTESAAEAAPTLRSGQPFRGTHTDISGPRQLTFCQLAHCQCRRELLVGNQQTAGEEAVRTCSEDLPLSMEKQEYRPEIQTHSPECPKRVPRRESRNITASVTGLTSLIQEDGTASQFGVRRLTRRGEREPEAGGTLRTSLVSPSASRRCTSR